MEGPGYDLKDLTPLLSRFMDASGNIDSSKAPPDMTDLLERLKAFQQRQQEDTASARSQPSPSPIIIPKPGFVVKAADASGTKFFVNICTSEHILQPSSWQQHQGDEKFKRRIEEAVKAAPGKDSEILRFPMSLGDPRQDKDHSGTPCTVLDVVFSPQAIDMAGQSRPLKSFLVELALAWAGSAHGLELGRLGQWKLPKMRYKGTSVAPQKLRLQRNEPNVEEIRESNTSGEKPQKAPVIKQATKSADLKQASSASEAGSRAEKAAEALAPASKAKQLQHVAKEGQSSKEAAKDPTVQEGSKASAIPATSAATSPKPAVPAEQRAAAIKGAPMHSTSQAPKELRKGPAADCKPLSHTVDFQGRPVKSVSVTVDLGDHDGNAMSGSANVSAPVVTVRRDQILVKIRGRESLHIDLPFGVDAQQGRARHMHKEERLVLELPYKPYHSFSQETCRKHPLVDDYGYPDSYFMQLER